MRLLTDEEPLHHRMPWDCLNQFFRPRGVEPDWLAVTHEALGRDRLGEKGVAIRDKDEVSIAV